MAATNKLTPEDTVDYHIRWAWHSIAKMYNGRAVQHGVTMSVGYVLLNIDKEGTPSTKLGPKMGMEPRSLTRTLKSMEGNGLIYKQVDKHDKRMVRIFLTDLGKKKRKISRDTVLGFNEQVYGKIPADKLSVFFEVIQEITSIVENDN